MLCYGWEQISNRSIWPCPSVNLKAWIGVNWITTTYIITGAHAPRGTMVGAHTTLLGFVDLALFFFTT